MHTRHLFPFALLALASTASAQTTHPAFTLGKDTTLITEPLHPDGTVNYLPALNALLSRGVTNDNNAAPLLLQITAGKVPDPNEARLFDAVHLPQPDPADRPHFVHFTDLLAEKEPPADESSSTAQYLRLLTVEYNVTEHPWTAADQPDAAQWLKQSAPVLHLLEQACQKTRCYIPFVPKPDSLAAIDCIPMLPSLISTPKVLAARAMQRAGANDLAGALDDLRRIRAIARLGAGQHLGVAYLMALATESLALRAYAGLATAPAATRDQLQQIRREMEATPLLSSHDPLRLKTEQYLALDNLMICIRGDSLRILRMMAWEFGPAAINLGDWANPDYDAALNETLRVFNDALADNTPDKPYQDELRDLDKKIADARDLKYPGFLPEMEGDQIKSKIPEIEAFLKIHPTESRADFSRRVARWLCGANPADLKRNLDLHQRMVVNHTLALLALDLADYRLAHGHYPASLNDLPTPAPLDPFANNKPFQYTSDGTSFTLNSVGLNTDGIPLHSHPQQPTTQPAPK